MADKYLTPQAAVDALLPGWKITGSKPATRKVPNTNRTTTSDPAEIDQQYGDELTVQSPDGKQNDTIIVDSINGAPSAGSFTDPSKQSGPAISVLQGPTKNQTTTTNKPSDTSKWQTVYRIPGDPSSGTLGQWDPVNNELHAVGAAPTAPASGKFDPVIVGSGTASDPTRQVGLIDTGDKSFHPLAAPPSAQPSGKYDNVYVTNADGTQRLVGMTDSGDKHFIPVSADPTTNKRTIQTPTAVYSVDDNDNVKKLIDIDKSSPYQAVVIDGIPYSFDPNEKDPNKRFSKAPGDWQHPPIKDSAQNTMVWTTDADGNGKYAYPPGVTPAGNLQTNTTAKTLDWYDTNGNLIKSVPNQNYQPPQVTPPTGTNTVSKMIPAPDPSSPNGWKWVPNEARVTASQALQNLASTLSGRVVDGDISVEEAKTIIDGANTALATQATAATNTLTAITNAAQTGAGVLEERARQAQGFVNQGLGILGQTKHGLLVAPPADFGSNLVEGALGFGTAAIGGADVFQAAANLVRRADPNGAQGQDAAAAYATLTQMFQKYRQMNGGQPSPEETQALKMGGGTGGQQATAQGPVQTAPQAAPWLRADQAQGSAPLGNAVAPAGVAGTVAPGSPQYLGTRPTAFQAPANAVPGQNYGAATAYTNGVAPWNAVPNVTAPAQPSAVPNAPFVAAPMAPAPPAAQPFVASQMQPITPQQRNITITVPTG